MTKLLEIFLVKKAHFEFDFALIAQESHLKNETHVEMWKQLNNEHDFLVSNEVVSKYVGMFIISSAPIAFFLLPEVVYYHKS